MVSSGLLPGGASTSGVVAAAEPGGTACGGDADDLPSLAAHADDVLIERC